MDRPRLPVILLGDRALALIRDIFDQPNLFADRPRIRRRVVAWGDAPPVEVEHSAVVVSEELLLDGIRPAIAPHPSATADWTVFAARPLPAAQHSFGTRRASAIPVTAKNPDACYIESLEDGWLFLVPTDADHAWLLAVGADADALLAQSRVIAPEVVHRAEPAGHFPAYPRLTSPLADSNWIACGSAAMAFDPICGDGTAHAIREAILAAAVLRALANGASKDELFAHYQARLIGGFERHLAQCRDFYRSGGTSEWWTTELAEIERGIRWCTDALAQHGAFRYQLRGLELERI